MRALGVEQHARAALREERARARDVGVRRVLAEAAKVGVLLLQEVSFVWGFVVVFCVVVVVVV